MRVSKFLPLLASCVALLGAQAPAFAGVDQQQLSSDIGVPFTFSFSSTPNLPNGQSFTAGNNQRLASISVFSNGGIQGGTNDVTFEVHSGDGLGGPLLGTLTETVSSVFDSGLGKFVLSLDVMSLGINQVSGSMYTFDFTNVTGPGDLSTRGILGSDTNPYAGGRAYEGPAYGNQPNWDLAFQTITVVPEPTSLMLVLSGLGFLGFRMRRG